VHDTAITATGLTRCFGKLTAVDRIDLSIPRAQIFGFLGPNGSGKTTAIRMLCGLLQPTAGSVTTLGLPIPQDAEKLRPRMGYMTQRFSLWDDLSVAENLHFIASIFGLRRERSAARIAEALTRYQLADRAEQPAAGAGGGNAPRTRTPAAR
jgi:ABC-2 type transport system ATP-binding protein